ncbi:MAG: adenylyltransferase/cytidyltransferase family protein [Candidatus Jorgensenbacteria bacterium]
MAIATYHEFPQIRKTFSGKKIVICTGTFDITHAGHAHFLAESKRSGDILVVGVGRDKDVRDTKGSEHPIIKEHLRLKMIDALRVVDYAFLQNSPNPPSEWLSPIREICLLLHPDIWSVNYDGAQMPNRIVLAKELGIELKILNLDRNHPEFEGLSTTQIIEKIKRLSGKQQD